MWCCRRMEKISWTYHVRNGVLLRVKERRNILHEISKRKANWIGHILRRSCLLQQVIEGKIKEGIEVTGRWGRRRRKLLNDLKERRGYSQLKKEALDRTMRRGRLWRGFGPVVRQTAKWINTFVISICISWLLYNTIKDNMVHVLKKNNTFNHKVRHPRCVYNKLDCKNNRNHVPTPPILHNTCKNSYPLHLLPPHCIQHKQAAY